MYAEIYDVNISGAITLEVENPEELAKMLEQNEGRWYNYDGQGVALLSDPTAWVFKVEPDRQIGGDPYPDWVVERDGEEFVYYEA